MLNINVVVRCRGRSRREVEARLPVVVSVGDPTGDGTVTLLDPPLVGELQPLMAGRTYTVDQTYGPSASQELVYRGVAQPLFREFVDGYNCTVFAYGQTGTGKTFTMCGDEGDGVPPAELSPVSGIIQRVMVELFATLQSAQDYSVRCSFLELYNEELRDLLSDRPTKLRIYEDRDDASIKVHGLAEVALRDAAHGMAVLRRGCNLRQTAATKMNDVLLRLHTVFTLHLVRQQPGEEPRASKFNLVDLAGLENVARSGGRLRESGAINQSLLALGRVINLLVDGSSHVPYRELKLTRLLQDSIGGATKTALIATVLPALVCADESGLTLEYAAKAKNIRNKPQLGTVLLRDVLLKDMAKELVRAQLDLAAARTRQGVFLDPESHQELVLLLSEAKTELVELRRGMDVLRREHADTAKRLAEVTADKELAELRAAELGALASLLHREVETQRAIGSRWARVSENARGALSDMDGDMAALLASHALVQRFLRHEVTAGVERVVAALLAGSDRGAGEVPGLHEAAANIAQLVAFLETRVSEAVSAVAASVTGPLPALVHDLHEAVVRLPPTLEVHRQQVEQCLDAVERACTSHLEKVRAALEAERVAQQERMHSAMAAASAEAQRVHTETAREVTQVLAQALQQHQTMLAGVQHQWGVALGGSVEAEVERWENEHRRLVDGSVREEMGAAVESAAREHQAAVESAAAAVSSAVSVAQTAAEETTRRAVSETVAGAAPYAAAATRVAEKLVAGVQERDELVEWQRETMAAVEREVEAMGRGVSGQEARLALVRTERVAALGAVAATLAGAGEEARPEPEPEARQLESGSNGTPHRAGNAKRASPEASSPLREIPANTHTGASPAKRRAPPLQLPRPTFLRQ